MSEKITMSELVWAVKDHAHKNYDRNGWDIIVETYDDAELADVIGNARTVAGAIRKVGDVARLFADRRQDIQGS